MEELLKRIKGYEKLIASLVVMVLLFFVCNKFVYQKQMQKRDKLQSELNTANYQYDLQEENKKQVEDMEKKFKEYKERLIQIRSDYPPVMQYEELMFLYQDFMNKIPYNFSGVSLSLYNSIKGPSVSSEQLVSQITDKDVLEKAYEMGFVTDTEEYRFQNAILADGSAYSANYSVTITGPMEKVWAFMDLLHSYRPKVAMTSFSLTGHEDGTVTAPISFSILGIMDKHVVGYSMLEKDYWKRTSISGKDNLFVRTTPTGKITTENLSSYTYDKSDFRMRLIPYTEGVTPETVMLEIVNPKEEQKIRPQVYGDDPGISEVEIYVEEKGGRYFAKIKTQDEAYPDKEYENTIEFVPKMNNLLLYIISSERIDEDDVSGVRIAVENNTDKKFIIKTKYDPEDNPRVSLVEKVGDKGKDIKNAVELYREN